MSFAIVYVTSRAEPRLDWLLDGLEAQGSEEDDVELIVVDAGPDDLGLPRLEEIGFRPIPPITHVEVTRPKPCVWQGDQRVTSVDWWAVANARNTGIALCQFSDYVVFLDDRCRIGDRWLETVRRGARERASVLAGAYDKRELGPDGRARVTVDHRLRTRPDGLVNCGGGWLYGCAMALPLEWCLEVNGFEEGCDSLSGEDYIFGLMLGNAGHRVDFVPQLRVHQDRMPGTEHGMRRTDKGTSPRDKSHAAIERFGRRRRTEFTPDLRRLHAEFSSGARFKFPDVDRSIDHRDWFDDQPIRDFR